MDKVMMRRWYQFRLSTAVIMMFAAAGWLWLNLQNYANDVSMYGIPMTYYEHWYAYEIGSHEGENWHYSALVLDFLFGIALIFVFGRIVERWTTFSRNRKIDERE